MGFFGVLKKKGTFNTYKKKIYYIVPLLKDYGKQLIFIGNIHKYVKEKVNDNNYEVKMKFNCEFKLKQKKIDPP